jgi:hypothetical protein
MYGGMSPLGSFLLNLVTKFYSLALSPLSYGSDYGNLAPHPAKTFLWLVIRRSVDS